jgi:hypothetical protein
MAMRPRNPVRRGIIPGTLIVKLAFGGETVVDDIPFIHKILSLYKFHKSKRGYAITLAPEMSYPVHLDLHRLIKGPPPPGVPLIIDHRNRNKLDNRMSNLRFATRRVNSTNVGVRRNNKSGVAGVHRLEEQRCWIASWQDEGGHPRNARFPDTKHGGPDGAKQAAVKRRALEVARLYIYQEAMPDAPEIEWPSELHKIKITFLLNPI